MTLSRRSMLPAALGALAAPAAAAAAASPAGEQDDRLVREALDGLARFGDLRAGGPDDMACGAWMEAHLAAHGYRLRRQTFETPFFEARTAELRVAGGAPIAVTPQGVVVPTGPKGVTGPLRLWRDGSDDAAMAGAVALLVLPYGRHSQLAAAPIAERVRQVARAGAAAIVIVTTGPTGEALALNADPAGPLVPVPAAVLGPRAGQPAIAAATAGGARATLTLDGEAGRRPAFNVAGAIERPGPRLMISTPRSGWGPCMGERGPGVAAFRALTAWAPRALPDHAISVVVTSGHEYDNLGGHVFLRSAAPAPADTRLWVHLGAGFAARDWHEIGPRLGPLPSADPQRILMGTPDTLPALAPAFAGLPGLEVPYPSTLGAAGELGEVLRAGYPRAFGMFGAHRYHHAPNDDARMVDAAFVTPVVAALKRAILALA